MNIMKKMKSTLALCLAVFFACTSSEARHGNGAEPQDTDKGRIVVSPNNRFLMYENGEPFYWFGDTAWMLVDKVSTEDARFYLSKRAEQGFTVVQVAALGDGFATYKANYHGETGFKDPEYTVPNDRYFDHVEKIIDMAAEYGLVVAFLPNWGDKICSLYGSNTLIFDTEEKAENYGRYIGSRMKDKKNVIYVLGGDRPAVGEDNGKPFDIRDIVRAQARGIAVGICGKEDYGCCTMTYHPNGWSTSAKWFHNDPWLDFNMEQNGHYFDNDVWDKIYHDYSLSPAKPVIDGEPTYESIKLKDLDNTLSSGFSVRRFMYHDLFAGAFGHTYGEGSMWRFYDPEIEGIADGFQQDKEETRCWKENMDLEGARQVIYAKNLIMSRPYFTRIPDNSLVTELYSGHQRITATRDTDNTYVMVYTEQGKPICLDTTPIGGGSVVKAWWFDPRTGEAEFIGEVLKGKQSEFRPETEGLGNDWVLVVDAYDSGYPAPGSATAKENL